MNKLSINKRLDVLAMLIGGESVPAISRSLGVSVNTVTKLLAEVGKSCLSFHNDLIKGQVFEDIQHKNIWSYALPQYDVWTLITIDSDSGFVIGWEMSAEIDITDQPVNISNKLNNHMHMLSLYFLFYNFCRSHELFHHTPAMQVGLSARLHDVEWIAELSGL